MSTTNRQLDEHEADRKIVGRRPGCGADGEEARCVERPRVPISRVAESGKPESTWLPGSDRDDPGVAFGWSL